MMKYLLYMTAPSLALASRVKTDALRFFLGYVFHNPGEKLFVHGAALGDLGSFDGLSVSAGSGDQLRGAIFSVPLRRALCCSSAVHDRSHGTT